MAILTVKAGGGGGYTTIQAALNAASNGDTIEIQDNSEYNEELSINDNDLTIQAGLGFSPILDGTGTVFGEAIKFNAKTGTTWDGIDIRDYTNANAPVFQDDAPGLTVKNITVTNCAKICTSTGATNLFQGTLANPITFENVTFDSGVSGAKMLWQAGYDYIEFENCVFDCRTMIGSVVIMTDSAALGMVWNFCTVLMEATTASAFNATTGVARNCVIINVETNSLISGTGLTCQDAYNCAVQGFDTNYSISGTDSSNLDGDVEGWDEVTAFVDYDNDDFLPASILLGAGIAIAGITEDIVLTARDDPPDIGAYEVAAPAAVAGEDLATNRYRPLLHRRHPRSGDAIRIYPIYRRR